MPEDKNQFDFINEEIIRKPLYRRRWFINTCAAVGLALIFGVVSGCVFAIVGPWADAQFGQPNEPTQIVVLSEETEIQTEQMTETEQATEMKQATETDQVTAIEPTETEANTETMSPEEKVRRDLYNHKMLFTEMADVASDVENSLVVVNGYTTETDWFSGENQKQKQSSGLIYAIDKNFTYVVTLIQTVQDAEKIVVTFEDGKTAIALLRRSDEATGFAMLQIPVNKMERDTLESISTVTLRGESYSAKAQPIIAVGSLQDHSDSFAYGIITSVDEVETTDNTYNLISTDILGGTMNSGLLLNLDGGIVGIITQHYAKEDDQNVVMAIPLYDLDYVLKAMVDNATIPYIGIKGRTIDADTANALGIPKGVYVSEVAADSPAMYAGLQVSDIIVGVGKMDISTLQGYASMMKSHKLDDIIKLKIKRKGVEDYTDAEVSVTLGGR